MIIKDSSITIMVKDMDKSIAFYQSLDIQLKNRWGNHYAQLAAPGLVIGLHPANDSVSPGSGNTSIGFSVEDFAEAKTVLTDLSIDVETREEEGGQFLHFTDPDGTLIYFIKPKW